MLTTQTCWLENMVGLRCEAIFRAPLFCQTQIIKCYSQPLQMLLCCPAQGMTCSICYTTVWNEAAKMSGQQGLECKFRSAFDFVEVFFIWYTTLKDRSYRDPTLILALCPPLSWCEYLHCAKQFPTAKKSHIYLLLLWCHIVCFLTSVSVCSMSGLAFVRWRRLKQTLAKQA